MVTCYTDPTKVRRLVKKIHKENNGVIGFEYDLNIGSKRNRKVVDIANPDSNPKKRQKTSSQGSKPKAKTRPKKLTNTIIGSIMEMGQR